MIEKTTFDLALDFVLKWEGGYVNNPADKGGETNLGVTANALRVAQDKGIVDKSLTVRDLTRATVAPIYLDLYWTPSHCPMMSYDLAVTVFDSAVNHGVKSAIRLMQRGLNALGSHLSEDGIWGRNTEAELTLALAYYPVGAALATIKKRDEYYDSIVRSNPSQKVFLQGWRNRINALRNEVIFS